MEFFTTYTTIFAPVLYFIGGIVVVMLLNKFIGKRKNREKNN